MNSVMKYLQLSPLYPLKGKFAVHNSCEMFTTITPLRGQGVSKLDNNILFPL